MGEYIITGYLDPEGSAPCNLQDNNNFGPGGQQLEIRPAGIRMVITTVLAIIRVVVVSVIAAIIVAIVIVVNIILIVAVLARSKATLAG